MARKYSNTSVETTLSNGIDSSQVSIQINDTGGLPPTFPFSLVLDFQTSSVEVVTVTNLSGGTLTVVRGQDGTAAQSHDAGAVVVHGVTARDLSEPQVHIDDSDDVHGVGAGSAIVGTETTQVLTNKTISGASNTLTGIDGSSLVTPFDGSSVDATFNSVILSGPDPDVNVATTLTGLRNDVDTNTSNIATNATDITALEDLFPPAVVAVVADDFENFNTSSFTPTSPACEVTFVANSQGHARIDIYMSVDADFDDEAFRSDVVIRETDSGGTEIYTPSGSEDGISWNWGNNPVTQRESFTAWNTFMDLTPGQQYWAQLRTDTFSTNVDIHNQKLLATPLP